MISNSLHISKPMCLHMTTTIMITPKILTQIWFRGINWSVRGKQRIIIYIDQLFGHLIVTACRISVETHKMIQHQVHYNITVPRTLFYPTYLTTYQRHSVILSKFDICFRFRHLLGEYFINEVI